MIDDYNMLARALVTMATTVPRTAKKQQVVVPSSWTRSVFENRDFFFSGLAHDRIVSTRVR